MSSPADSPPPVPSSPLLVMDEPDGRSTLATLFGADYSGHSITPSHASDAPLIVRSALSRFATFDATHDARIGDSCVVDIGDAHAATLPYPKASEAIGTLARNAYARNAPLTIGLGGDHSISAATIAAFADSHPAIGVLQLDIHHDVRSPDPKPTNGSPIRQLIEGGILAGTDIVQIGIHPFANAPELSTYCDDLGIHRFAISTLQDEGTQVIAREAIERLDHCETIYLTVDIDVLDRSFAPGTVAALPGGLTPAQLMSLVDELCFDRKVRAIDIVEFDPSRDVQHVTAYAACMVMMTALSATFRRSDEYQGLHS